MKKITTLLLILAIYAWNGVNAYAQSIKTSSLQLDYDFTSNLVYTEIIKANVIINNRDDINRYSKIQHMHDDKRENVNFESALRYRALSSVSGVLFQEPNSRGVRFSDLRIGDIISYKVSIIHHAFQQEPGYSSVFEFNNYKKDINVLISYRIPNSVKIRFSTVGMESKRESIPGATIIKFRLNSAQIIRNQKENKAASITASSYNDYKEIGAAYWAINKDKVDRLPTNSTLVDIDGKNKSVRDVVNESYSWVQKNLSYKNVPISESGFSARSLDTIRREGSGDCKDHVLLLQAILRKNNIASQPALVNTGPNYTLPNLPVAQAFDHVVLYVPELKLYFDTTSKTTSFGILPVQLYGKPVLLASAKPSIQYIPPLDGSHNAKMMHSIQISSENKIINKSIFQGAGIVASAMRATSRNIKLPEVVPAINNILIRGGIAGASSELVFTDKTLDGVFESSLTYNGKYVPDFSGFIKVQLRSVINSDYSVRKQIEQILKADNSSRAVCYNVSASEKFDIIVPSLKLPPNLPRDISITTKYFEYRSSYKFISSHISAIRSFTPLSYSDQCNIGSSSNDLELLKRIIDDLNTSVSFSLK